MIDPVSVCLALSVCHIQVCEHNLNGPERHLYAAILLQKLEAFRILPSALWEYGHEASSLVRPLTQVSSGRRLNTLNC